MIVEHINYTGYDTLAYNPADGSFVSPSAAAFVYEYGADLAFPLVARWNGSRYVALPLARAV